MNPITISIAITGVLATATSVSHTLNLFLKRTKKVPDYVRDLLPEIETISTYLTEFQQFLTESTNDISNSRLALLLVVLLTDCVINFSDLEKLVDSLGLEEKELSLLDRVKWNRRGSAIERLLSKLRADKDSLRLMLKTLTWHISLTLLLSLPFLTVKNSTSTDEAQTSTQRLNTRVLTLLQENNELSTRLKPLEKQTHGTSSIPNPTKDQHADITKPDDQSIITTQTTQTFQTENTITPLLPSRGASSSATTSTKLDDNFSFDNELDTSRVYQRFHNPPHLSDLNLSEIPNIPSIKLPIVPNELWNGKRFLDSENTESVETVKDKKDKKEEKKKNRPRMRDERRANTEKKAEIFFEYFYLV